MMRKREIRGYSLYSGVKVGTSSHLKAVGLGLLVIVGVVGVCGLTTFITQQTDRLEAASRLTENNTPTTKTQTTTIAATTLSAKAADTLQPIKTTQAEHSSLAAKRSESSTPQTCTKSIQTSIRNDRTSQLREESSRHRHVIRSLQATGLLTKLFNPYLYSSRVKQENTHHKDVLQDIQKRHTTALKDSGC